MQQYYFILLSLLFLIIPKTNAQPSKIDPLLLGQVAAEAKQECMILMKEQADLSRAWQLKGKDKRAFYVFDQLNTTAEQSQASLLTWMDDKNIMNRPYWVINAVWVLADLSEIEAISRRSEVAFVVKNSRIMMEEPVHKSRPSGPSVSRAHLTWGLEKIRAEEVWNMGFRGQGVVIGGQDTGYEWEHPAIKVTYRGWNGTTANHNYNWHDAIHAYDTMHADTFSNCGLDTLAPCDDGSHGTHTMGTMASVDTFQFGVAPDAKWIGCRNMERGYGTPATYLECFQWFLAPTDLNNQNPDPSKAPHVINNSWSCPPIEGCNPSNFPIMNTAINSLRAAGTVVVVSAGNDGDSCYTIAKPAAIFEGSFTIGASAENDSIARFSSRGPVSIDSSYRLKPNVTAPGVNVYSSIPGGFHAFFSGTSMAGPHTVGAIALLISADTTLAGDVERIESLLEQTAIAHTDTQNCVTSGMSIPNPVYGHGVIDIFAAVTEALLPTKVADPTPQGFDISPNPFGEKLRLHSLNSGQHQLRLFDAKGQLILQQHWSGSDYELDGSQLGAGFYILEWRSDGEKVFRKKVVKM